MPCRGYRGGDEPQWPEEESLMDVDYQEQAAYQSAAPRRSRAQVPPRPSTFLPVPYQSAAPQRSRTQVPPRPSGCLVVYLFTRSRPRTRLRRRGGPSPRFPPGLLAVSLFSLN